MPWAWTRPGSSARSACSASWSPPTRSWQRLALTDQLEHRSLRETGVLIVKGAGKAVAGLSVSIALAFGLPALSKALDGPERDPEHARPDRPGDEMRASCATP